MNDTFAPGDGATDILDRRGRLRRLAAASALGLMLTVFVIQQIARVATVDAKDPIGQSSVVVCAIGVFLVATSFAHLLIERVQRRFSAAA